MYLYQNQLLEKVPITSKLQLSYNIINFTIINVFYLLLSSRIGKIYSAETQVVAGTLTRIVADLVDTDGNTKKGKISIWNRSWLPNGVEVTFEFDGEDKIVRKHNA